jgi:hypothetical protein
LVQERVMPTVSHSWKASVPIRWVATWPVMTTMGMESIMASAMPVTALVAPGPEVTRTTPAFARRTGIALGGMGRALLVADQDVAQGRFGEEGVIDRQHRAARIAEQGVDALVDEAPAPPSRRRTWRPCNGVPRGEIQPRLSSNRARACSANRCMLVSRSLSLSRW